MIAITSATRPGLRRVKRFFRSPKGHLLLVLAALTVLAAPVEGLDHAGPTVASAVIVASLVDMAIVRWIDGRWFFPSGAILSGLIVALVLSPAEPLFVPIGTAAVAVVSKYVFRSRWSNVFNPAALALIVAYFVFGTGESWWGSLPDLPVLAIVVLLAGGLIIVDHVNKLPMVLTFLIAYFALFAASAFLGDPLRVAEIFRSPDVNAVLFFALFMLDDPPTTPVRYRDQIWFGLIVAVASYAIFLSLGAVYYLLAGLLVGNAWETLRRFDERSGAQVSSSMAS